MSEKKMRVPMLDIYRRSPFQGLLSHARKICECLEELKDGIHAYIDEDFKTAEKHFKKVQELEHEADIIKGNTRNHLPRFIFMPVDRSDFLILLNEDDAVLDHAEDVAVLMKMRPTRIPEDLKGDFRKLADTIVMTGLAMEKVVCHMTDLLETSFVEKEREQTKELIKMVHDLEYKCDRLQEKVTRHLLNDPEIDPITVLHLMKVVERMGQVADSSENAADRIRVMMGK